MNQKLANEFLEAAKKKGFVDLLWKGVIHPVTGMSTEMAKLTGESFDIDVVLTHPYVVNPEDQKEVDETKFTQVDIFFSYLTEIGPLSYMHVHKTRPFEKAREYAQWQATLIHHLLSKVGK